MNSHPKTFESYWELLKDLSPSLKLDLISKLTESVKNDIQKQPIHTIESFGAWQGEDAEKVAREIRDSRFFNRKIEEL